MKKIIVGSVLALACISFLKIDNSGVQVAVPEVDAYSVCWGGCTGSTTGRTTTISCKDVEYACGSNSDGTTMMCIKSVCTGGSGFMSYGLSF